MKKAPRFQSARYAKLTHCSRFIVKLDLQRQKYLKNIIMYIVLKKRDGVHPASPEGLDDVGGDSGPPLVRVGLPREGDGVFGHLRH